MNEAVKVDVVSSESGPVVIQVAYPINFTWELSAARQLEERLVSAYREDSSQDRISCVIELIDVQVASSAIVRAIYGLYEAVENREGKLAVVGYPAEYDKSIVALGLMELPGFSLNRNSQEAIEEVNKKIK